MPDPRPPRLRSWAAAAAAMALAGCASTRLADAHDAYFRRELSTYRYEKGCLDVWPAVLELLGARGYPLRGRDRAYAGQPPGGAVAEFLGQGFETRRVEGSALYVKTGWRAAQESVSRYLVSGTPVRPSGCAVSFTLDWRRSGDPSSDRQEVDWEIQRDLLERLEPDAAARIEAGAPKG